ncbi:MAG: GatB/YqeY domain-containing protein [Bacilli bacterium]|jgi:uncharacterized protein YqeY
MLLDDLKLANLQALKLKDTEARAILSVAINKCNMLGIEKKSQGFELLDSDVLVILQKVDKELDEEIAAFQQAGNLVRLEGLQRQKKALSQYLPQLLTEAEIVSIIAGLSDRSLPAIMNYFKQHYSGKCDMKTVSILARRGQ